MPAEVRTFLDHYDAISSDLGDSFWQELTEAIDYARDHPERHHFDRTGRRRSNLKRFPVHTTGLSNYPSQSHRMAAPTLPSGLDVCYLWFNGRRGSVEQIGLATHAGEDLGF